MHDKIIFDPNSKSVRDLCLDISPEAITRVKIIEEEGDLMIEITYGKSSSKVLLNLDDRVIEGVEKGLKQLWWINRKRNAT